MSDAEGRRYRVGTSIEDLCRACKAIRLHTIMAIDAQGEVARVVCDFCRSEHNYRGGGGEERAARPARSAVPAAAAAALPPAGERERTGTGMSTSEAGADLEGMLRRVLREELGLTPATPAEKWRGGELVLRPGKPGLQEKTYPIEAIFNKIVMIRNRLRTLEQQVNASELPADAKLRLQGYITGCYGSLTSFNVLFARPEDQFRGSSED